MKLTEKSTWYKEETERRGGGSIGDLEVLMPDRFVDTTATKEEARQDSAISVMMVPDRFVDTTATKEEATQDSAISVMIVPFTKGAELAKRVRLYEMVAEEQNEWYMKVVERAGDSLTDLLHRSDP